MEVAKLKKMIQKITDVDNNPHWYLITGPGDKYINHPPFSLLKLNEAEGWVECVYLENGQAPGGDPVALNIIDVAEILMVGTYIQGKDKVSQYLKNDMQKTDEEIGEYIRQFYR